MIESFPLLLRILKSIISWSLVLFCVSYVIDGQIKGVSRSGSTLHVGGTITVLVILIVWLAILEGGQVGVVVSGAIPQQDQLEKFFMGRQLLVLFCVFGIAVVSVLRDPVNGSFPLSINSSAVTWIAQAGFISSLAVTVFGQQVTQTIASRAPSFYANSLVVKYLCIKPSLLVVNSGVLHSVLLLKMLVTRTSPFKHKNKWVRVLCYTAGFVSAILWGVSSVYVVAANVEGKSNSLTSSAVANVILLIILWVMLCYIEGLQVALTVPGHKTEFCDNAEDLKKFLIGRQVLVAFIMFILSGITAVSQDTSSTVLRIPSSVQLALLESGVCGALFLVIGQLLSRVLAAHSPSLLLSPRAVPLSVVSVCYVVNASGFCTAAEDTALLLCYLFGIPESESGNESADTLSDVTSAEEHKV